MHRNHQLESINRLIRQLIWQGHKQAMQTMEQLGLTVPQASVLFALESNAGQASMSDLARMAQLSPATMTGIVDRLIAAEWVERTRDDHDRRIVWVRLTAAGQAKVAAIHATRMHNMERFTSDFSAAELEQLEQLLHQLLHSMLHQSA